MRTAARRTARDRSRASGRDRRGRRTAFANLLVFGALAAGCAQPKYPTVDPDRDVAVQPWPEPPRTPLYADRPNVTVAPEIGVGSPVGHVGALAGWNPASWVELEAGVGAGGRFGPATSEMVRFVVPSDELRTGIGLGVSQNYLSPFEPSARAPGGLYAGAPLVAHYLNVELAEEVYVAPRMLVRVSMGMGFLLNAGQYSAMCRYAEPPGGQPPCWSSAADSLAAPNPWTVVGGSNGAVFDGRWLPYVAISVPWMVLP